MILQELSYVATIMMGLAAGLTIVAFFNRSFDKKSEPPENRQLNKVSSDKESGCKGDDVEAQK